MFIFRGSLEGLKPDTVLEKLIFCHIAVRTVIHCQGLNQWLEQSCRFQFLVLISDVPGNPDRFTGVCNGCAGIAGRFICPVPVVSKVDAGCNEDSGFLIRQESRIGQYWYFVTAGSQKEEMLAVDGSG